MPTLPTIALFMVTALALNVTPGPAILFILSRCLGQGRAAAVVSVFGLATASIIQAVAAAFGLSALFAYSPIAFDLIKYCGAAYLVYLGVSGFLKGGIGGIIGRADNRARSSLLSAYWQGFLTDLLNPKLLLFFFSFLPQFVDPTRGEPAVQMLVLGFVFQLTGVPTNLAVAFAGGAGPAARAPPNLGTHPELVCKYHIDRPRYQIGFQRATLNGSDPIRASSSCSYAYRKARRPRRRRADSME